MFFKEVATGLDFGRDQLKLVQAQHARGATQLERAVVAPSPPPKDGIDATDMLAGAVQNVLDAGRIRARNLVISVGPPSYVLHCFEVPPLGRPELVSAVRCALEGVAPFPLGDALIDFRVSEPEPGQPPGTPRTVVAVAVNRQTMNFYLGVLGRLHLRPIRAEVPPLAVIDSFLSSCAPGPRETTALVDIGHGGTGVTVLSGSTVRLHRYIPFGGMHLTRFLAAQEHLDERTAESHKRDLRSPACLAAPIDQLSRRVERILTYFEYTHPTEKVDRVLVSGGSARLPGLLECLSDFVGDQVGTLEPCGAFAVPADHRDASILARNGPALTVAWGLVV